MIKQQELFETQSVKKDPRFPLGAIVMRPFYHPTNVYFHVREIQTKLELLRRRIIHQHKGKLDEKAVLREMEKGVVEHEKMRREAAKNGHAWSLMSDYEYQCRPVPYGYRMDVSYSWYDEEWIFDTGLRWRVPTDGELDDECRKRYTHLPGQFSGDTGYDRHFLAVYHTPLNGQGTPRPEKIEPWHYNNKPLPCEEALVHKLDSLNPNLYPRWQDHQSEQEFWTFLEKRVLLEKKK